jgi:hypothetical protein
VRSELNNAGSIAAATRVSARHAVRRFAVAIVLLLSLSGTGALRAEPSPSAQIIVGPGLEGVALDRDLLRAVFTLRLRAWPNGPTVRIFVLPDDNPLSDLFYREQLGMYSYVLRAAWDRMVFTGTGLAPTIVHSEQEMRERVRLTPGAIGYVSGNAATYMHRPPSMRMAFAPVELE